MALGKAKFLDKLSDHHIWELLIKVASSKPSACTLLGNDELFMSNDEIMALHYRLRSMMKEWSSQVDLLPEHKQATFRVVLQSLTQSHSS